MKENKLTIKISKSVHEVFEFTINPDNTPKWIDEVAEELAEYPIKVGTKYKNRGDEEGWTEYFVSDFEKDKIFELKALNSPYVVRYTYKTISPTETELTYHEWMEEGELDKPFAMKTLENLKQILETQ